MKRNIIIAIVAAGAVVGGGTLAGATMGSGGDSEQASNTLEPISVAEAGGSASGGDDDRDDRDDRNERNERGAGGGEGSAAERAVHSALTARPGVVTEIELDDDDDDDGDRHRAWEVEIFGDDDRWYEVHVSEDGREVLDSHDKDDDDDDDRAVAVSLRSGNAEVDVLGAIRLAEQQTSAALREADVDDGHWELELRGGDGAEHELSINLGTGNVTDRERDDDDDRDDRGDDDWDDRDDDRDDRDDNDNRDDDDWDDRDDDRDDRDDDRDDR
ncbi:PepSY domain-containing protein [Streptomyces marincola]|uniref:PepSY domain-containing protein n=1 Tax=Streptomyces marincola TaxID=2878388 RepID=A0A1W7CUA5_9ACTN|nr:PepSY domain-containing protein [Streptomyces marincola]ARQ68404.1 hypothetical protein CAG99_05665 [Streptomyces marincola]